MRGGIIFIKLVTSEALASPVSPFSLEKVICQLVMHLTLGYAVNLILARESFCRESKLHCFFSQLTFLVMNLSWFPSVVHLSSSGGFCIDY